MIVLLVLITLMIFLVGHSAARYFVVIEVAVTAGIAEIQPGKMIAERK